MKTRVAVCAHGPDRPGGVARYLAVALPELRRLGLEVSLFDETAGDFRDYLHRLSQFRPHVTFLHGLANARLESAIVATYPTVFLCHDYYGACISGQKYWARPAPQTCSLPFGKGCLVRYYPRRCGGKNPKTFLSLYLTQRRRAANLRRAGAVITLSQHLRKQYLKQAVAEDRCHKVPYAPPIENFTARREIPDHWNLLFFGRMESTKGGQELIPALSRISGSIGRALNVRFVGEGSQSDSWRALAEKHSHQSLHFQFQPWAAEPHDALFARTHYLLMPSVWPEPWGLSGVEALGRGVPVIASLEGGSPEWLQDGENGFLFSWRAPQRSLDATLFQALQATASWPVLSHAARQSYEKLASGHFETVAEILLSQTKKT